MKEFIRDKVSNRVRQFGLRAALAQTLRAVTRLVRKVNRDIVFVIPAFAGYPFSDPAIKHLTNERILEAVKKEELGQREGDMLLSFTGERCVGLCAEVDGKLAGYALLQFDGVYRFGQTGQMVILPKHAIVKNLIVSPEFRGHKLGSKLNAARLALIPEGHMPVVFIIPENRYAIRNWEQYGFQRVLAIKRWRWLGGRWQMRIDRLSDSLDADALEQALIDGHRTKQLAASFREGT